MGKITITFLCYDGLIRRCLQSIVPSYEYLQEEDTDGPCPYLWLSCQDWPGSFVGRPGCDGPSHGCQFTGRYRDV